jgi:hypothetical protein
VKPCPPQYRVEIADALRKSTGVPNRYSRANAARRFRFAPQVRLVQHRRMSLSIVFVAFCRPPIARWAFD